MSSVLKKYKGNVVNYKQFEEIIKYFDKQQKPSHEEVRDLRPLSFVLLLNLTSDNREFGRLRHWWRGLAIKRTDEASPVLLRLRGRSDRARVWGALREYSRQRGRTDQIFRPGSPHPCWINARSHPALSFLDKYFFIINSTLFLVIFVTINVKNRQEPFGKSG